MGLLCNRTFEFGLKISLRRCASVKHGMTSNVTLVSIKVHPHVNCDYRDYFGKDLPQCEHGTGAVHEMVSKMVLVPDF